MSRRSAGEGSITRRKDGRWQGSLQLGGRRRFVYGATRAEAAAKLDRLKQGAVGNVMPDPGKRTVNDLLDSWLSHVAGSLKPRTVADYRAVSDRYIRPHVGHLRLGKLSPMHVQAMYSELQSTGAKRVPSYAHSVLHRACEVAVIWRWMPQNPCDRVLKPSYRSERREVWTLDELKRFLDGTRDSWLHPLWTVAVGTGCRLGELLALTWEDVDSDAPSITVRRNVQRISRQKVYSEPKTKAGDRTIMLPAEAMAALKRQKAQQATWRLKSGLSWQDTGLVFTGLCGNIMDHSTVEGGMRREVERLDLPKLTPHGLRHLAASLLIDRGLPITAVAARLGHANASITTSIYSHAIKGQDRQAAEMMERVLR
jgi:integrase